MKQVCTVGEFTRGIRKNYSNPMALNSYRDGEWVHFSTQKFMTEVRYLALALVKIGIKKGDRVGIIAEPSARWTIADLAIMLTGAISVPLFANISEENFLYEIRQAEVKTVFVTGHQQWMRYEENKELFERVISLEGPPEASEAISFEEALHMGAEIDKASPKLFEEMENAIKPEDLATIIYTSGSTGVPKGAEHTHASIFTLLHVDLFKWDSNNDIYLSILPLAHVFGRMVNFITISWGISTYYFNDLKNLGPICKSLHPTILVVVPRLLERVYAKMIANVEGAGLLKRAIGHFAFDLAIQEDGFFKNLFHPLADKLVYSTLREALGGNLRVVLSGGAPLNPQLCMFFRDIGVPIYEGWGLTEACPITVNRPGLVKVGTIGMPIDELQVELSSEGELLVKGVNLMRGYLKNPEATAAALDSKGWLHTGDLGTIDSEGYISIIGRMKELFKTSTGEKIAPIPIEQALCKAPFIDMALVIAEKRKFASCLLFPNFEILSALKTNQNQAHLSDEEFLKSVYIKNEMETLLSKVNAHLNQWEQIHAYRFVPYHLTIDKGELTPSMKIRRDTVEKKFSNIIEGMYEREEVAE